MRQIQATAGEGAWRILSIVAFPQVAEAKHSSPGANDPRLQEGEPVLVLLERELGDPERRDTPLATMEHA